MKRHYYVFSNGRLVRKQNTVYLWQYEGEREDGDEISLADAAAQAGCVLEGDGDGSAVEEPQIETDIESAIAGEVETVGESQTGGAAANDKGHMTKDAGQMTEDTGPLSSRRVVSKRPIPIEDVEAFHVFGEMDFNTKLLNFLARHRVPVHIYNYFGFYSSTIMPRQEVNSGFLLVRQVEHYADKAKRMVLARALVDGASFNILKNLRYYGSASRGRDLSGVVAAVETQRAAIPAARDVYTVMGIEGHIRKLYYEAWPLIFSAPWAEFEKRVKHPPDNPINALISFGNSLCYTLALSEIYRTPLSPLISFLHEPGARRYSLSLDLAEIFKPILCDRMVFKLVNNGELRPEHFDEKLNFCYLKESGRKIFLAEWDERLKQTIDHRNLGKKVSYRRLVRLECYALQKHLLGVEPYQPFKIWW